MILQERFDQNRKLKLHPSVFYRLVDELVVLYHTEQQKVFTFNSTTKGIFDCFSEFCLIEGTIQQLNKVYKVEDLDEFRENIKEFVAEVFDKGILVHEHKQTEAVNNLDKEVSRRFANKNDLYSATIELTYKCNEKCRHCYIVEEGKKELTTSQIKDVLNQLADLNVFSITFTGGEVFTRKDAFEILEYAYSKNFVVEIFTNGNLLSAESIFKLKAIWPRCIHFSVYSHIAEKHDAITQVQGSFEKSITAIKACVLIGIQVNIKTPIFSETMEDILELVKFSNSLGVSIGLGNNITPKKNGDLSPTVMKVTGETDNNFVFDKIGELIESDDLSPNDETRSGNLCGAGGNSISINPYGEVFPCSVLPLCIGNVSKQSIKQIWTESKVLSWWRENNLSTHKKGCSDCRLIDKCVFCPGEAMMRTGDPLAMYEEACQTTKAAIRREIRKGGKET